MMGKIAAIFIVGLLVARCGNNHKSLYTPAPKKEADLGFVVTASQKEISDLQNQEPNASIRALSSQNGIYEVSHIESSRLKNYLKNKDLQKNFFLKATDIKTPKLSMAKLANNTSPDAISALASCQRTDQSPSVGFDVAQSSFKPVITLGESVTLSALGEANKTVGGSVRLMWDMLPPTYSQQSFEKGIANSQTLTPDSVGVYQIAVIAQGMDSSCAATVVELMVTANPEITPTLNPLKAQNTPTNRHLDQIKAQEAWKQSTGKGVVVAVIDSGINYNHPSIRDQILIKTEQEESKDGNGFEKDIIGWDFANGDNKPFDDAGHGSHVSGLIASNISGVAPDAKIIPIKVLDAAGSGDFGSIIAGIYYAINSGAQIINMSLGFEASSAPPPLVAALQAAHDKNIIVLVAAGNGDSMTGMGYDIGTRPYFPAAIQIDNILTVAATGENLLTSYSNFSKSIVSLSAPGGNENEPIISLATLNPSQVDIAAEMGTSMATPITAGVAALVLSANPLLSPSQINNILMESGDLLESLKETTISGKQVNAQVAVKRALDLHLAAAMN